MKTTITKQIYKNPSDPRSLYIITLDEAGKQIGFAEAELIATGKDEIELEGAQDEAPQDMAEQKAEEVECAPKNARGQKKGSMTGGSTKEKVLSMSSKGMTASDIAKELNLTTAAVSYHLRGGRKKDPESRRKMGKTIKETTEPLTTPMTEDEFDKLKYDKTLGEFTGTHSWSKDNSVPLYEVNKAVVSASYEEYLETR